jgi:mannitol 2-dehydrogenase
MTQLSPGRLGAISGRAVVPRYDRSRLRPGIVHIGVGGFHRAHQAVYLDDLMNTGRGQEWAVWGAGLLDRDRAMAEALAAQGCLYTVMEKGPGAGPPRVIGSITRYLYGPDRPAAVIEAMASPSVRVVSLTITEGGYGTGPDGEFDPGSPEVAADMAPGGTPQTAFGFMVEALWCRHQRGLAPFTVLSCDNVQGNGAVARQAVTAVAQARRPAMAGWLAENGRFPSSMVDRITPVTTDDDRAVLARQYGVEDRWPVVCEPFRQWVVEDSFTDGRPPLEDAGVQLVSDVHPFETLKLRLLNASHQAMCYLGLLAGHQFVHEVANDPLFAGYLLGYMEGEAAPTLPPVAVDVEEYARLLVGRFANPEVKDTLARLGTNSSDLMPKFLLPVVRAQLERGGPVAHSATAVAAWARYAQGRDEGGRSTAVNDRRAAQISEAARREDSEPGAFLDQPSIFGDVAADQRFRGRYLAALRSLGQRGVRGTLTALAEERRGGSC